MAMHAQDQADSEGEGRGRKRKAKAALDGTYRTQAEEQPI
jgi:hypothetical protein